MLPKEYTKRQIMFVCKGNIQRSVVAEELLRSRIKEKGLEGIRVISRGLHGFGDIPPTKFPNLKFYENDWAIAEPILREFGVSTEGHVSTPVSAETMRDSDVIFAMDQSVYDVLAIAFPECANKLNIFGQGIPDPEGIGDIEKERLIITSIQQEIPAVLAKILKN